MISLIHNRQAQRPYSRFGIILMAMVLLLLLTGNKGQSQNPDILDSLRVALNEVEGVSQQQHIYQAQYDELTKGDPAVCMAFTKKQLHAAVEMGQAKYTAQWFQNLALCYSSYNHFDSALYYSKTALQMVLDNQISGQRPPAYLTMAEIYQDMGRNGIASENAFKALELLETIPNNKHHARALNVIGWSYMNQGLNKKAGKYFRKAYRINQELNDSAQIASSLVLLGSVYRYMQQYDSALSLYQHAIAIYQRHYNPMGQSISLFNMAQALLDKEAYGEALETALLSEQISKQLNDSIGIGYAIYIQGKSYFQLDSIQQARDRFNMAYEMISTSDNIDLSLGLLMNLYRINYQTGHYQEAATTIEKILFINDSLYQLDNPVQAINHELDYSLERERRKAAMQRERQRFQILLLAISLFFVIIIAILLWRGQRNKKITAQTEKKRLAQALDYRNKELTTHVMYLVEKNEFMNSVSKKLNAIQDSFLKEENRKIVSVLIKDIKQAQGNNLWPEFELRFKEVHSEFYEKLNRTYPNLSNNEIRLSAFLRLNMTTKEISALTQQSGSAIEVARSRLRKKLGISHKEISLNSFLGQL